VRSSIGIDVAAPPELLFELARRVDRWAALLPHYLESRPQEPPAKGIVIARFVAVRPIVPWLGLGVPVTWRSRTWSEPDTLRLRFQHLGGPTAGMDVTWRIGATATGCRVTIEHDFQPRVRPWALVIDRLAVRPIAGRTLATFKAIAEAVVATGAASAAAGTAR
jgi:ribosome-associated toxin RatA of RatAB toxin-antitoxin module